MLFPEYSFRSEGWKPYLIDIRQAIENTAEASINASEGLADTIEQHVGDIHSELNWALTLVAARLDEQTDLLQDVVAQLASIHAAAVTPLFTQAQELLKSGQHLFKKQLYKEALQFFLKAEKVCDIDFPLQLDLGFIYLFGCNEKEDVTDFLEAEKHFLLAARYAPAYKDSLREQNLCAGQAYNEAARAAYLQSQVEKKAGRGAQSLKHLERAFDHTVSGIQLYSESKRGRYLRAKILSLLGRNLAAINEMKYLADQDRRYLAKAYNDTDFITLRSHLADLSFETFQVPSPISRQARNLSQTVLLAITSAERAVFEGPDLTQLQISGQRITKASADVDQMNADMELFLQKIQEAIKRVSCEGDDLTQFHAIGQEIREAIAKLDQTDADMERLWREIQSTMRALVQLVTQSVHSRISPLQEANRLNNNRIEELEQLKAGSGGIGLGCFLWILIWFVVPGIVRGLILLISAVGALPARASGVLIFFTYCLCFLAGPLLLVLSIHIQSAHRNLRLNVEMEPLRQAVAQRENVIATWTAWLEDWTRG